MKPEVGKTYTLIHQRKAGTVKVKVLSVDPDWMTVEILKGRLKGMGEGNVYLPGDECDFRIAHCVLS